MIDGKSSRGMHALIVKKKKKNKVVPSEKTQLLYVYKMDPDLQLPEPEELSGTRTAIESMSRGLCLHPVHRHSFAPSSVARSYSLFSTKTCTGCQQKLFPSAAFSKLFGASTAGSSTGNNASNSTGEAGSIVTCVACGSFAHRSCALATIAQAHLNWGAGCPCHPPLKPKNNNTNTNNKQSQSPLLHDLYEEAVSAEENPASIPSSVSKNRVPSPKNSNTNTNNERNQSPLLHDLYEEAVSAEEESSPISSSARKNRVPSPTEYFSANSSAGDQSLQSSWSSSSSTSNPTLMMHSIDMHLYSSRDDTESSERSKKKKRKKRRKKKMSPPLPETDKKSSLVWSADGPPKHWALDGPKALQGLKSGKKDPAEPMSSGPSRPLSLFSMYPPKSSFSPIDPQYSSSSDTNNSRGSAKSHNDEDDEDMHYKQHPFQSVSNALQENIFALFQRMDDDIMNGENNHSLLLETDAEMNEEECQPLLLNTSNDGTSVRGDSPTNSETNRSVSKDDSEDKVDVKSLLKEVKPKPPPPIKSASIIASEALDAVRKSSALSKTMGIASVAGGVVGGVAGLYIAGPAGAIIGAKLVQSAGVLGVILDGSVSVGVFVASVAGFAAASQLHKNGSGRRVLSLGERGTKRKVVLVRPNVVVDPVWEDITAEALRTHATNIANRRSFNIIGNHQKKVAEMAKRERYLKDSDIVQTDESEIKTKDKVLLLVSRTLNDKLSLPGHVYRCLIQEHRARTERRTRLAERFCTKNLDEDKDADPVASRERRQDTHGAIKHVTATLLEVRPGFGASPVMTEMSATAVEGLVFGELYDSVFEEIIDETRAMDAALLEKISQFELDQQEQWQRDQRTVSSSLNNETNSLDIPSPTDGGEIKPFWNHYISDDALHALCMIPEAHSAVDKLEFCVQFLELISVHFSSFASKSSVLSADSLLKMVCQHIIAAKVPNINAEIAFLEEFARDVQLLRGKEGYALVTMQASLHFLNASSDLQEDIFAPDEEDNLD